MPCLYHSLHSGDNAVVHCVTGVTRAAFAAAIISSVLHQEPLGHAIERIHRSRATTLFQPRWDRNAKKSQTTIVALGGPWAERCSKVRIAPWPVGNHFMVSHRTQEADKPLHWGLLGRGDTDEERKQARPVCRAHLRGTAAALKPPFQATTTAAEAAARLSRRVCDDCLKRLTASVQLELAAADIGAGRRG